jgi:hypothetical protein
LARKTLKNPSQEHAGLLADSASRRGVMSQVWPDAWAQELRLKVDGHPFSVVGREFQIQIIRDESDWIIVPKGAQMGLTTVFLVRTFHWIVKRKWHHLYLMPLKTGAIPFVQGRIDPIIASNESLAKEFKSVDNRLHKQTVADIALRIRGTNIWTELREIPSDVLVMDERDKMVEDNIPEAMARLDGSMIKRIVELSTPTAPGHGVDAEDGWHVSDQHRWFVPCPHCNRRQVFTVDENIVIGDSADDSFLRCAYCKKTITDRQRGELNAVGSWEPMNVGGSKRGYHISQLNSPTQTIPGFMRNYFDGQTDSKKLRAWYNNNRGEPFVAEGDQITVELLDKCRGKGHQTGGIPNGPVFVGVDVGSFLHVRANYLDRFGRAISWAFIIFRDKPGVSMWAQLDEWLENLPTFVCVIDAHPEKSQAKELARKYFERVFIGFSQDRPDQAETAVFNDPKPGEVGKVNIDLCAALDNVINRLMTGRLVLPADAREIGEILPRLPYNGYYNHLIQMVRVEEEDTKGRDVARWLKNKNPDHWHSAEMFADVAALQKPYLIVQPAVGQVLAAAGGFVG